MKVLELANKYLADNGYDVVLCNLESDTFFLEESFICFVAADQHGVRQECSMYYADAKGDWAAFVELAEDESVYAAMEANIT